MPLLEEDAVVEANVPYRAWLNAARGRAKDLQWLMARFAAINLPEKNSTSDTEVYQASGKRRLSDHQVQEARNPSPRLEAFRRNNLSKAGKKTSNRKPWSPSNSSCSLIAYRLHLVKSALLYHQIFPRLLPQLRLSARHINLYRMNPPSRDH